MKKCSVLMIAEDPDNHTRICDDNNMRWYDPESSSWYKHPTDFILPVGEFKALRENPPINWKILNWEYDGKFGQCGQFVNVEFTDENMPKFCYVEKISTPFIRIEGEVIAMKDVYFKRWLPLVGDDAVEFGEKTALTAMNGKGKTTIYDAFYWLLFGKNSDSKPSTLPSSFRSIAKSKHLPSSNGW